MRQIVIEAQTPGDSRTMFRLRIDKDLIAEGLTAVQAHILVAKSSTGLRYRKRTRSLRLGRRPWTNDHPLLSAASVLPLALWVSCSGATTALLDYINPRLAPDP
jgi:hypothetical protein